MGRSEHETSLDNLRVCVWSLRKALGDTKHRTIASDGDDIVLDSAAFDADVLTFRCLANQAGSSALEAAANLYTGEFLDGLSIESEAFETWRRTEAQRLRAENVTVLVQSMTQATETSRYDRAVEIGERALALDPLHEPTIRRLMHLYGGSGQPGAAIQVYRMLVDALHRLGAQPEAETSALFAEIARGTDPVARLGEAAEPPSARPRLPLLSRRRVAWIGGAALAAVAAIVFLQRPALAPSPTSGVEAAKMAAASPASAVSIAVLPFLNLSGDPAQDFFSDGITEEIGAALARVPELRVVARTSAFQFRGERQDIPSIGRQLRATHIIEGSVRWEGDRLRITAQLVDASTGVRVSSEIYDRQLSDIFSTQEDIARNVVGALMAPLGLAPGERLITSRGIDPESYQQFLRAKALLQRRGIEAVTETVQLLEPITLLEPIVAQDVSFAPAWGQLALAYQRIPFFSRQLEYATVKEKRDAADQWLPKAETAANRAIELDPYLADGYSELGLTIAFRGRLVEAERLFSRALALDPLSPEALHSYANLLSAVGHTKEALATKRQLVSLEPFVLVYQSGIQDLLWINGQTDALIANLRERRSAVDLVTLAKIYSTQGRRADAINALTAIPPDTYPKGILETAVRILRDLPGEASSLQTSPRLGRRLNFVYIEAGVPDRALERFEDDVTAGYSPPILLLDLWTPIYAPVRKTERFKAFARNAGLVEYWRVKGWPDLCRPVGADDFACD